MHQLYGSTRYSDSYLSCTVQDDEEALLQGEKEAEKMIVEAYAALLLAFLSTERFVCQIFIANLL